MKIIAIMPIVSINLIVVLIWDSDMGSDHKIYRNRPRSMLAKDTAIMSIVISKLNLCTNMGYRHEDQTRIY